MSDEVSIVLYRFLALLKNRLYELLKKLMKRYIDR